MILIVKSSLARNTGTATVVLALLGTLAGCGQPGDLYLPKPPAKPAASSVQPAPATAPSTSTSEAGK
jgi:predicted small lipoprotein YifL